MPEQESKRQREIERGVKGRRERGGEERGCWEANLPLNCFTPVVCVPLAATAASSIGSRTRHDTTRHGTAERHDTLTMHDLRLTTLYTLPQLKPPLNSLPMHTVLLQCFLLSKASFFIKKLTKNFVNFEKLARA